MGALTSPRLSMRRRSDPGDAPSIPKEPAGKVPDLPKVEEESLSRRQSAEIQDTRSQSRSQAQEATSPGSPTSAKYMDWGEKKPRLVSVNSDQDGMGDPIPSPPSTSTPHGPPSPPPRVQDILPSEDEVRETHEEDVLHEHPDELSLGDEHKDAEVGTLGLENVGFQSDGGHTDTHKYTQEQAKVQAGSEVHGQASQEGPRRGRDSAVLGFDRSRFGGD